MPEEIDDVEIDLTGTPSPDADPAPFPGDADASSPDEAGVDADADAEATGETETVEPVELLVQLAERGEIDPWDIDVVRVTDRFLDALESADLRAGGRALFYASVLLRMKSEAVMADDETDAEADGEPAPWEDGEWTGAAPGAPAGAAPDAADGEGGDPFAALEREMERRIERKRARGMPRTLDELVHELREAERGTYWKESRSYDTSDSPRGYARGTQTLDYHAAEAPRREQEPTVDEVTGTAHDEDMDRTIRTVYRALRERYDQGRPEVLFREIDDAGPSLVETFLALLFLDHRGQVRLRQDDLFGDLWVVDPATIDDTAETAGEDAGVDADGDADGDRDGDETEGEDEDADVNVPTDATTTDGSATGDAG